MKQYLCVIESETVNRTTTYGGFCVDLPATVNSKSTREEVMEALQEAMALALVTLQVDLGRDLPDPTSRPEDVDTSDMEAFEFVHLCPAPVDPVSLELNFALKRSGLSITEVARRMGTSRNAVYRLLDPTYHGHSFDSVRRFAEALSGQVVFKVDMAEASAASAV
ncbi:type II toxin-antitoxin system HicB family antitoxin [Deinococcus cellulosilyticus]|uniref:Uncharacterized protein n=1 Tax=Deinococcus cellulosilyticus (strain DSM 18568 / NBRC 106333 / KACC 11606 / 5516J-15) TaxID=1223518 RepID=A0A511NAJ5_DEIC1|nr:type II toxin-antitoxin system HicB family antitoxin [Deinococcus cellulosilyticus]GEM49849.1 hypothetical protein DC3_54840 [Deinococcus cellulosilyticus NBRC 106333 = KACC 11606]